MSKPANEPTGELPLRADRWNALSEKPLDVAIIGGGITGAGVALDLGLRGVRVGLFERGDWACGASSASSRLIHGGLRYLEGLDFGLVRESCIERARLLGNAAGLVWPERFVFPLQRGMRTGRVKLAAGLALYTVLSVPRPLGVPRILGARKLAGLLPGADPHRLRGAGAYLDAATHDSRLTLAVVLSAVRAGAVALSRAEALAIEGGSRSARVELRDAQSDERRSLECRAVVLAGGPFTDALRARAGLAEHWMQPTRGSHLLVPRERLPTDGSVIFQSPLDGRVMFLLAWPRFTAVGTTDLDADPAPDVRATRAEVHYLLDSANALVPAAQLGESDVVSTWAGLRPLFASADRSPSARPRDERILRERCVYTIAGGKLTTWRAMAEKLASRITEDLGIGLGGKASPTRRHALRGAMVRPVERPSWSSLSSGAAAPAGLDWRAIAWSKRYGSLSGEVLDACRRTDSGEEILDVETRLGEIDWCVAREDCLSPEDFLLRRTDLGFAAEHQARESSEVVLRHMAALCLWSRERCERERQAFGRVLERLHGWKREPGT